MTRDLVALSAVCLVTFVIGLGRPAITDSDEAYYAESAREMVESGDWLTPRYNYRDRFEKPVLFYWLAAAGYAIGGVSEAAARLPAALAGLALVLVTYVAASRWADRTVARLAAVIVATSAGTFLVARLSLPDLPLAFFIVLSTWALFEGLGTMRPGDQVARAPNARRWLILASVAAALGFLTKGPVAPALPLLSVLPVLALARRPRDGGLFRRWTLVDPVTFLLAVATFALIALPWFAAMVVEHGWGYLDRFFVAENLERFATDRYNDPRPVWFYVPILLAGLFPWSPLVVPAVLATRTDGTPTLSRFEWHMAAAAVMPLLFYTVSIGKQPRYILPMLAPLAILLAGGLVRTVRAPRTSLARRLLAPALAVSGALLIGVAGLLFNIREILADAAAPGSAVLPLALAAMAGSGAAVVMVAASWRAEPWRGVTTLAAASAVALLALYAVVFVQPGRTPVRRMAQLVLDHADASTPVGTHQAFVRNLVFYTGRPTTDLPDSAQLKAFFRGPAPVLCVLDREVFERLDATLDTPLTVLGQVTYFDPGGFRLGTLAAPDPARDHRTVVLVTTAPDPARQPRLP